MGTNQYECHEYSEWIGKISIMVEIYINLDITFDIKRDIYLLNICKNSTVQTKIEKKIDYLYKKNDLY